MIQSGIRCLLLAACALLVLPCYAQSSFYEVEPNNSPATATEIAGEVILLGTMLPGDQDGFKWNVSDVDAQKRWTFKLEGIPGKLTVVDVIRLEYAANGVDVQAKKRLFSIGSRDGLRPALVEDLIFEPGEYILGFANAGGAGIYRPPTDTISFNEKMGAEVSAAGADEPGAYRLTIGKGSKLYLRSNPQDRATKTTALNLRPGSADATYLETPKNWYEFKLGENESKKRWDILGQISVGREAKINFYGADDTVLISTVADRKGKFSFTDLGLEAGTYYIEVDAEPGGFIRSLTSIAVGELIEGAENEPNDTWVLANRVDINQALSGRMGKAGEDDYFRFMLPEDVADQMLNLELTTGEGQKMNFCLTDENGKKVQCRTASGSVSLPDLVLTPGTWGLLVSRGSAGSEYNINLSRDSEIIAGQEAEPNDKIEFATAIPAKNRIKGHFSGKDDDYYTILISEKPQLWRIQVIGDQIHELAFYDGAGVENQRFRVPASQRRVRLDNVFMLPGIHHIRVSGNDGGKYTLLLRPLGAPDLNGELEPNDDVSRMQGLKMGQTRTGLLEDEQDRDNYRFHLANWDRIGINIQPAADAEILVNMYWDTVQFKQFNLPEAGKKIELSGLFPPGDYRLELKAKKTSEAEYSLGLERLDRFGCPTDCEPNDNFNFASAFPENHIIEGQVNQWRDADWFKLPLFDQPTEITLTSENRLNVSVLSRDDLSKSIANWDAEAGVFRGSLKPGRQYYLHVRGAADTAYRIEVNFSNGLAAMAAPATVDYALKLDLETGEVAAYREFAQQINGLVTITNSSAKPVNLELESATSDYRWQLQLDKKSFTIPAASKQAIPVSLAVPADAWAEHPVRISVRAFSDKGSQVTTFTDIAVGRETLPVNPAQGWAIPKELLGGFNLARDALGGRWVGEKDTAIGSGFPLLFDGMAVENGGLKLRSGHKSDREIIIDLAGEEPVEVLGLMVNQLSSAHTNLFLRNLDFSLSLDGAEFTPVLANQLLPIKSEQAFVLKKPQAARYARLQLKTGFSSSPYPGFNLGEVKVIARPGLDISNGQGFNLADPLLGGHVIWSNPAITASNNWDKLLLTEPQSGERLRLKSGQSQEFVIGFQHDRAAQINRLEWLDVEGIAADEKFKQVSLSVSTDSPLGPWTPIGSWDLASSASPATFELKQPVWARFVKFSMTSNGAQYINTPALVKIWERPVNDNYLSILGEWGFASQQAIYELQQPLQFEPHLGSVKHDSKANAAILEISSQVSGQVALGKQAHWYKVNIPATENTLTVTVSGAPTVRTVVQLENSSGEQLVLRKLVHQSSTQVHTFEAIVEAGQSYYLRVEEPPRNVVFLWDTSASVGAYLPVIYTSLMAYAEGVVPGRDSVNMMPFGGRLLLRDWYGEPYILQTVLNDYNRKDNSSEAEATLARATKALAPRAGTKAIVLITDAATNRYPAMWDEFQQVHPRIFALGLGSQGAFGSRPSLEQDLLQDWSRINGGHYTHMLSEGDMEIAFDRASTMLRRAAAYSLEVNTSFRDEPGAGSLKVISADNSPGGAVELILDASGSMLKRLDGKRRIGIAKEVLSQAVKQYIPEGTPLALRVFGHKQANACRTDLEIPLAPLEPDAATSIIQGVNAKNLAKTPIADSLAKIESDLKSVKGRKVIVLVTDGEETCEGRPAEVIAQLQDKGLDLTLNIVGFAIDDAELEASFKSWAQLGNGRYFSASSQEGLSDALQLSLQIPYIVYDSSGSSAGQGVVGGDAVELEQGFYRVVVATSPPRIFEKVEVTGEKEQLIKY